MYNWCTELYFTFITLVSGRVLSWIMALTIPIYWKMQRVCHFVDDMSMTLLLCDKFVTLTRKEAYSLILLLRRALVVAAFVLLESILLWALNWELWLLCRLHGGTVYIVKRVPGKLVTWSWDCLWSMSTVPGAKILCYHPFARVRLTTFADVWEGIRWVNPQGSN